MNLHVPPRPAITSSVGTPPVSGSRRTSASSNANPSAARRPAIPLPIPEDDPVTMAQPLTHALLQTAPRTGISRPRRDPESGDRGARGSGDRGAARGSGDPAERPGDQEHPCRPVNPARGAGPPLRRTPAGPSP